MIHWPVRNPRCSFHSSRRTYHRSRHSNPGRTRRLAQVGNCLGQLVTGNRRSSISSRIAVRGRSAVNLAIIGIRIGHVAIDDGRAAAQKVAVIGAIVSVGTRCAGAGALTARSVEEEHRVDVWGPAVQGYDALDFGLHLSISYAVVARDAVIATGSGARIRIHIRTGKAARILDVVGEVNEPNAVNRK